jgi:nucleotide sugar dehydrogenase
MSYIVSAVEAIAAHLHPGMLVVLESTTYPGTTEEVVQPLLERGGSRRASTSSWPSRPSESIRQQPVHTRNVPKVIGGTTPECAEVACALQDVDRHVVPVSSTRVAEMVKLLENTFRAVNIGLVNEIALMCDRLGINVWEVVDAARPNRSGSCLSIRARASAAIASPSTRSTSRGKPSSTASNPDSSSSPDTSTARCRTPRSTRSPTR